ncbi:MAG: M3 family oligoendopeptidase [Candidatus Izemoplasmataceae bacterium]
MKFQDYVYKRPDMEAFKAEFTAALDQFINANTVDAQEAAMDTINQLRFNFNTMHTLASVKHTIDTKDEFYDKEEEFFNENSPIFSQLNNLYYKALTNATFADALKERKGTLLFDQAEQSLKTFKDEILPLLQEENKLTSAYQKLLAGAEIDFEGEKRNLSQMAPFAQSKDRAMRKNASSAVSNWFSENEKTLDELYDKLVKIRVETAEKLGYPSFTELAYDRLGRLDYGKEEVANYRKQVLENIVPLVQELVDRKGERLGIKNMMSYDLSLDFLSGNPTPKGGKDWMVERAHKMYSEMSDETRTFFEFMLDKNLMDLEAKKGKAGGGYCTYIPNYQSPFIFANFNGTKHDVDVLTHEAGHAFQVFSSRHHEVPEYLWATLEASEIHSMSMEFFAWPWINLFFEEDTEKYKFSHLSGSLTFIPYGVAVDEFQHEIYANPNLTPDERKSLWREIEKKYLPYKQYDNDDFLERGGFWFRQGHIFSAPFYYIDYTLAQVCAFQYWVRDQENHEEAWNSYVKLCQAGGSKPFVGLIKLAGLKNPFEDGTIAKTVPKIKAYLDSVDDTKL